MVCSTTGPTFCFGEAYQERKMPKRTQKGSFPLQVCKTEVTGGRQRGREGGREAGREMSIEDSHLGKSTKNPGSVAMSPLLGQVMSVWGKQLVHWRNILKRKNEVTLLFMNQSRGNGRKGKRRCYCLSQVTNKE